MLSFTSQLEDYLGFCEQRFFIIVIRKARVRVRVLASFSIYKSLSSLRKNYKAVELIYTEDRENGDMEGEFKIAKIAGLFVP